MKPWLSFDRGFSYLLWPGDTIGHRRSLPSFVQGSWHQAITWTSVVFLSFRPLRIHFNEISVKPRHFHCRKCSWKCCQHNSGHFVWPQCINSFWPSDTLWQHRSGSLAQVIAYCLMAPSHYLNQCWLLFSEVLNHSPKNNITVSAWAIILNNEFENDTF